MTSNKNDKRISDLPRVSLLTGDELVPVVQNGANRTVTLAEIAGLSESGIGNSRRVPVPETSSSPGQVGDYAVNEFFRYDCITVNTWVRVPVSTF